MSATTFIARLRARFTRVEPVVYETYDLVKTCPCGDPNCLIGMEFAVSHYAANDAPTGTEPRISVTMHPATMKALTALLAERSGMPLFNANQWSIIEDSLKMRLVDREAENINAPHLREMLDILKAARS